MKVEVIQGSLTSGKESVLVNASNTGARLGSGVSHAIRLGCGGERYQEHIYAELLRLKHGPMEPGDFIVTDAGSHPHAKYVVHVAVMDYRGGTGFGQQAPDAARIERSYRSVIDAVRALEGDQTLAMVALGAGTGGFSVARSVGCACETLKAAALENISGVVFYAFTDEEFASTKEVVARFFPRD